MFRSAAAVVCLLAAAAAGASETVTMDPLLKLLVKKGVVSEQEAVSLQAEYTAMKAKPAAAAQPTARTQPAPRKPAWSERIKMAGDLRLRYEGFDQAGKFDGGRRDRMRLRLRFGLKAKVTERLHLGIGLRSGNPDDPVSDNQTLDGGFSKKELNIAEAFLDYRVSDTLSVIGGKFAPKKLWHVSDMQWDDDVVVEGAMERFRFVGNGDAWKGLDIDLYQYVLEESKTSSDAYLLGGQIRPHFRVAEHQTVSFGAGFDSYSKPDKVAALTLSGKLDGNKMTNLLDANGRLVSDFRIASLFVEWKNGASKRWPVKVSLFAYRNLGAEGVGKDNDSALFGRVQIGDYKKPGQVAVRYSYYYSEPDALFYAYTQSDTTRSSDLEGHRFDFRIGGPAKSYFNLTWSSTKPHLADSATMNRWQVDYIVKF